MEGLPFAEREEREEILALCRRMTLEFADERSHDDFSGFANQAALLIPKLLEALERHERKDGGPLAEQLREALRAYFMTTINGRLCLSRHAAVQSFSVSVVGTRVITDVRMEFMP